MSQIGIGATTSASTSGGAAASIAPAKPASLAVGDLLVAIMNAYLGGAGGGTTITPPAGWTSVVALGGGALDTNLNIFEKVADANDVAASTFTFTLGGVSVFGIGTVTRLMNVDTIVPIIASHATAFTTTTAPADAGLTAGIQPLLIMAIGHTDSTGRTVSGYAVANANPTWTEQFDSGEGHGCALAWATAPYTLSTATGSASATLSGAALDGVLAVLALQPARQRPSIVTVASAVPGSTPVIQHRQTPTVMSITTSTGGTAVVTLKKWATQAQSASGGWTAQAKSTT